MFGSEISISKREVQLYVKLYVVMWMGSVSNK